jgi:sortase (surface protein transpeptidase)
MDRRRLAVDALTAVLAVGGLTLVVIGAGPAPDPSKMDAKVHSKVNAARPAQSRPGASPAVGGAAGAGGTAAGGASSGPGGNGGPAGGGGNGGPGGSGPGGGAAALAASVPVRLDIPAIGISTALMSLGLNADGTVAVPPVRADAPAGWYRNLRTPGEVGPSVILGHVDTAHDGPAVFYRLRELRPGDTATVRRADGSTAVFTVDRVVEVAKSDFPTGDVYGPVAFPALRLVTCGGTFDHVHRTYRGNIVVYATLTATAA